MQKSFLILVIFLTTVYSIFLFTNFGCSSGTTSELLTLSKENNEIISEIKQELATVNSELADINSQIGLSSSSSSPVWMRPPSAQQPKSTVLDELNNIQETLESIDSRLSSVERDVRGNGLLSK